MSNLVSRDKKKRKLYSKYEAIRMVYKSLVGDERLPKNLRWAFMNLFNQLPRNSSKVRIKNRCIVTGRGHAVLRFCRLSRIQFRSLASQGLVMGVTKSSW